MLEDMKAKIIALDATCITLANPNGSHHTRSVNEETKVRINGKDSTLADLKAGDLVTVSGDPVGGILIGEEPKLTPSLVK